MYIDKKITRKCFSTFSKISGYSNWVIAKADLTVGLNGNGEMTADTCKNNEVTAKLLKQKKNYALMSAGNSDLNGIDIKMDMHLIRIVSENGNGFNSSEDKIKNSLDNNSVEYIRSKKFKEVYGMIFEKYEIINFVNEVGDENPIHRTKKAVVPGFMIMERLIRKIDFCNENNQNKSIYGIEIKYIMPVFEGEMIYLFKYENILEGWVIRETEDGKELNVKVFEVKIKAN